MREEKKEVKGKYTKERDDGLGQCVRAWGYRQPQPRSVTAAGAMQRCHFQG